jgi:uncharacterized protein DUF6745
LSLIEIARLSDPQCARLAEYGQRWTALRSSSAPSDRAAAEVGVEKAYAAAGLPPPRQILWGAGPLEIATSWARLRGSAGDNVRSLVVDSICRRAEGAVDRAVGLAVRVALAGEPRLTRVPPFCTSIEEAVHRDCERVRPQLRELFAGLWAPQRFGRSSFASCAFAFQSAPLLGALEYFHDVCNLTRQTASLAGLWQTAKHASWMLPHREVCWLSDRPLAMHQDARGRLHRADGPAVTCRDGWSAYAWKGVLAPSWIIERPDLVNVRTIGAAQDPQVRRCMIEIMTPERFIKEGGAYRIAQDEAGILWRQRWRWEAWAAVEVINGTPEPDGTLKHYFLQVPANMRSPREAVAWTYGLPEQRYRPSVRT